MEPETIDQRLSELEAQLDALPDVEPPDNVSDDESSGASVPDLREQLLELEQGLNALPEAEEPPQTTLQILRRSHLEGDWQRLLVHFLEPEMEHGLGTDLLEHVLTSLSERPDLGFTYSRLDLEDVKVAQEVSTGQGRPDAVIWVPGEWFLCIEMKVTSSEGNDQTRRYVEADAFRGIDLTKDEIPEDEHYYLYLAPADSADPEAVPFVPISWEWLTSRLKSFVSESYGGYPARTTAQLNDFIDTIRAELTMTDYQQNKLEKVELAIEHYEAMIEVLDELEEYVERIKEEWPEWFLDQDPDSWEENWHTVPSDNSYMHLYHTNWSVNFDGENKKQADICVYWVFRVSERHLGQGIVDHRLAVTGESDDLLGEFRDNFHSEATNKEIEGILADLNESAGKSLEIEEWSSSNTYKRLISSDYEFEFNEGQGFKETVAEAFEDMQPIFALATDSVPSA